MASLRDLACRQYLSLTAKEREVMKKRFATSPTTLAQLAAYEEHERTGEPLKDLDLDDDEVEAARQRLDSRAKRTFDP